MKVLMFHRVLPEKLISTNKRNAYLKRGTLISLETFIDIIDFIHSGKFICINMSQVSEYRNANNIVVLTFDDGYSDNFAYVLPVLEKYGITATFFPVLKPCIENCVLPIDTYYKIADNKNLSDETYNDMVIGKMKKIFYFMSPKQQMNYLNENFPEHININEYVKYLNEQEIKKLSEKGFEIGSHTVTHSLLTSDYMTKNDIIFELSYSKKYLQKIIDKKVNSFCFPSGYYNREIVQMAKDTGYNLFCSIKNNDLTDASIIYERFFVNENSKKELLTTYLKNKKGNK